MVAVVRSRIAIRGYYVNVMCQRSEYRMPVCCRCNGSGRCINCSCTKSARPCVNCLPLRKGLCRNQDASTLSPVPVPSLPAPSALDGIPPLPSNPDNLADTPPSTQLYVPSASSDPDDAIVDEAIFDEAIPDNAIFDEVSEATRIITRLCQSYRPKFHLGQHPRYRNDTVDQRGI